MIQADMIFIYGLVDPFTGQIRYIGKSVRPKERLTNHCNEQSITYRTNWIRSVIAKGKGPEITILQSLPNDADWQKAERDWIAKGRALGWPLTNCTDGGDGVVNLPPEIRKRISQVWIGRKHKKKSLYGIGSAMRGKKHTAETKAKMSASQKGRKITWIGKIAKANQKLSDSQIKKIHRLIYEGVSQYVIADRFKVHQGTISNIKRGICYK